MKITFPSSYYLDSYNKFKNDKNPELDYVISNRDITVIPVTSEGDITYSPHIKIKKPVTMRKFISTVLRFYNRKLTREHAKWVNETKQFENAEQVLGYAPVVYMPTSKAKYKDMLHEDTVLQGANKRGNTYTLVFGS